MSLRRRREPRPRSLCLADCPPGCEILTPRVDERGPFVTWCRVVRHLADGRLQVQVPQEGEEMAEPLQTLSLMALQTVRDKQGYHTVVRSSTSQSSQAVPPPAAEQYSPVGVPPPVKQHVPAAMPPPVAEQHAPAAVPEVAEPSPGLALEPSLGDGPPAIRMQSRVALLECGRTTRAARRGLVVGHRSMLGARNAVIIEWRIAFDGGGGTWLSADRLLALGDDDADVLCAQGEWQQLPLGCRCVFTLAPLLDPARGRSCMHPPMCNYDALCKCVTPSPPSPDTPAYTQLPSAVPLYSAGTRRLLAPTARAPWSGATRT